MSEFQSTIETLKAAGFSEEEVNQHTSGQVQELIAAGFTEDEVAEYTGVTQKDKPSLVQPIIDYWNSISDETRQHFGYDAPEVPEDVGEADVEAISEAAETIKEIPSKVKKWAVGNDAEFGEYWARAIGKSNIALALQYHAGVKIPTAASANDALTAEPEDTGHIERWWESITAIGADLPTFIGGGLVGNRLTGGNPYATGFSAGFVNDSIKHMYIEALNRGDVKGFKEWWNIFIDYGFKEGVKSGITLGTAMGLPKTLGLKDSIIGNYATQYMAFTGVGSLLEGKLPTSDELINTALVLGTFGGVEAGVKGKNMVLNRSKESNKSPAEVVSEVISDPRKLEDVASSNIKEFRDKTKPEEAVEPFVEGSAPKVPEAVKPEPAKPEPKPEPIAEPVAPEVLSEAVNAINSRVQVEPPSTSYFGGRMKDFKSQFVTQFIDKLHPILSAVRRFEEAGGKFDTAMNPYLSARIQPGIVGRAMHAIRFGTLDFKTLNINGKSLIEVFEPIKNTKDLTEARSYLIAKRALEKDAQGKKTGIPIEEARLVVKELDAKYGQLSKDLTDYQTRIMEYLVDSGIVSKENAKLMLEANKDYVPFYRVLEETTLAGRNEFGKSVKNPYKQFKGSERQILDPIQSIYGNTIHHMTIAERNKSFVDFIEMVEQRPEIFPEVFKSPARVKATKVEAKEMAEAFDAPIRPEFAEGITVFRREHGIVNDRQIAIFRNGKREIWEVGPELGAAFKNTNRYEANLLLKFLSVPSRLLRAGSTLAPDFMLRNFNRDTVTSAIMSDKGFIPFVHSYQGFWHMLKSDKLYQEWTKSGAMQSMMVSMDRNYLQKNVKDYLIGGKVRNQISNPLEMLRIFAELFESTSRIGNYKLSHKHLSRRNEQFSDRDIIEKSGFESRDLTIDFAKIGTKVQAMNQITAFFNARLQGYARLAQAFKENPKYTLLQTFKYITAPSILLWYVNHDDPRYQQLPQWQKDLFWIVITPEIGVGDNIVEDDNDYTIYRIPKPFEPGLLFGTLPERMLDWAYNEKGEEFLGFVKEFATSNISGLMPVPDFAKPMIEFWSNKNMFNTLPIIPYGTEKMLPEYQYSEYTSETAKLLGKTIAELTGGNAPKILQSPAQIDQLIANWTGTLGRYAVDVADKALKVSGVVKSPDQPLSMFEDLPIIKAFLIRNPAGSSEFIQTFYKKYRKAEGLLLTLNKLQRENNQDEISRLIQKSDLDLLQIQAAGQAMSTLRELIRTVHINPDINKVEKRQLIDDSYQTMIDIAKFSLEAYFDKDED